MTACSPALKADVCQCIQAKDWDKLRQILNSKHTYELGHLLREVTRPERLLIFRLLDQDHAARAFRLLSHGQQDHLLRDLTNDDAARLLKSMGPDDQARLMEELPAEAVKRLYELLTPDDLKSVKQLLGYPPQSIGRIMTTDFLSVHDSWTVSRAIKEVRERGHQVETIDPLYVVNPKGEIAGYIELKRLLTSNLDYKVDQVAHKRVAHLTTHQDREAAVHMLQRHRQYASLPVTDSQGKLVGVVAINDAIEVASQEATEDIQKGAAVTPLPHGYSGAGVQTLFQRRVIWLIALVLMNIGTAGVISAFEETLEATIVLATFMPMLIGSGGNTGAQSATLLIRALSTRDVQGSHWIKVLFKEIRVGLAIGIVLALLAGALAYMRGGLGVSMVVAISMLFIILFANMIGSMLPFIFTKLKMDPAVASGPLVTTSVDVFGLFLFFSIAAMLLTRAT
jgi:magnesium transporter